MTTPDEPRTDAAGGAASDAPDSDTPDAETPTPETAAEETPARQAVNPEELARTLEALLFAAEESLAVREMARAAGSDSASVRKVLPKIKAAYDEQRKPWDLVEVAGGYRLVTRPEFHPAIQRLKTQTAQRKLTQAALETLALIAYRQPIGRAEVESVRGVGAGPVLRLLLEKKLIRITGRGAGLGQPLLYGTTDYFLEHFGLKSIEDLPKLGDFKGA
ncbi:MAG: SMC-Scp complex subunit ScpB [Planctomycetota bacterium]|nr:SMC-Scp complex subunit ScpB [Planctomycetota bacterium]